MVELPGRDGSATVAPASEMALMPRAGAPLAARELVWEQAQYDAEISAARRQMARGAAELAEGKVRLATLLLRLRSTQDYTRWGYAELEDYLQQVHRIGKRAAYEYMRSLEALGPALMQQLLLDVGMQRTYCLAQIRDHDPEVFAELLELPVVNGSPAVASMELHELQRINAELTAALEEAYERYRDKDDEMAAAVQISRSTRSRIEEVDRHNRDLVMERDRVRRDLEKIEREKQQERNQRLLAEREAKRTIATLERQLRELSGKLRQPLTPDAAPVTIEVIATNDPQLLAGLIQLCARGVRGTNAQALHSAAGPAHDVGVAVGDLIAAGVPAILIAAVRACATAVSSALEPGALTLEESTALRGALREFGAAVAPALRAAETGHG